MQRHQGRNDALNIVPMLEFVFRNTEKGDVAVLLNFVHHHLRKVLEVSCLDRVRQKVSDGLGCARGIAHSVDTALNFVDP